MELLNFLNQLNYLHFGVFINIILIFIIKPLLSYFGNVGEELKNDIKFFKSINIFLILTIIVSLLLNLLNIDGYSSYFFNIYLVTSVIYISLFVSELTEFFIRKSINPVKINGVFTLEDNYQTHILKIISKITIFILMSVVLLHYYELDSLLKSGGFIGIILATLAFTSRIWAPDLIEGLIVLKNPLVSPGDVVKIDDEMFLIHKMGFFDVVLINIMTNNTQIMRNKQFRDSKILVLNNTNEDEGLRQTRLFSIDYGHLDEQKELLNKLDIVESNLKDTFLDKYKNVLKEEIGVTVGIESFKPYYIVIFVEYYLDVKNNLDTTYKARELFTTYEKLNKILFTEFKKVGISLETYKKDAKVDYDLIKHP